MVPFSLIKLKLYVIMMFCSFCLIPSMCLAGVDSTEADGKTPRFSPAVNSEGLRGLSTIGSAESMGEGRITFSFIAPWYKQQIGYLNTPNAGAFVFTGTGAFTYGVNGYVDLFASIVGFGSSNYTSSDKSFGLGTIKAGAQGSFPFPRSAFIRMGGQAAIVGGTSRNQINTYRADGYNYFETRTGYDLTGKFMQTLRAGTEDWGFKFHLNEGGAFGIINQTEPALLLLGAGLQANMAFVVLGTELNSRTRFNDMSFGTDPLWFTPSVHFRTPFNMNAMAGVDISLSRDRADNNPRALEPYRVFAALALSFDMLESRRNAIFAQKQKEAQEKKALEDKNAMSKKQIKSLSMQAVEDSIALADEKKAGRMERDATQRRNEANKVTADALAKKATADSLALIQAASDLAAEKEKRSDAEKMLLSTGELLLDAVYFNSGKTIISINSKPYLNIIGKMLVKYPKLQIEIAGHTDNVGSDEFNMALSQGRAESVRSYLIQAEPALYSKLNAHGYGESLPKADNDTKDGRLANRRVELRVINKDALLEYSQL